MSDEPGPRGVRRPRRRPRSRGGEEPEPRGAFEIACRYLTSRERCAAQVRSYLQRQGFSAEETAEAIRLLREKRFVDDLRYARAYVEVRSRRAPRSGVWLARELVARGVDQGTAQTAVEEFLKETPEEELARRLLARMAGDRRPDLARRAALRLRARGFRTSIAIAWAREQERTKTRRRGPAGNPVDELQTLDDEDTGE